MKVLVTGGTGVIGAPTVRELLVGGHEVRLLSRNAERDARQFDGQVEPVVGSIAHRGEVTGSAEGCDAILHVAGIVREEPPEVTFESINVNGARNVLEEAERAKVEKLLFVSSLSAERGQSDYHRSKLQAEDLIRTFSGNWLICRPGGVIGPGDELISLLIRMMRTLPAVPVIDGGGQVSQPVWFEDLARALRVALEREDLARQTLELAGNEVVTTNQIINRLEVLLDRHPARVPVPGALASMGVNALATLGIDVPFTQDQITMLTEENRIQPGETNGMTEVLGITPTPWQEALERLVHLWAVFMDNAVGLSGGTVSGAVEAEAGPISGDEEERIDAWIENLVMAQRRDQPGQASVM